ncbi:MAG TPA: FecR domain-containing protein [Candidatus Limnocylindria bacterium]|nr:FecR domain-containing protein [Candidatus Limnocylindria bacterium]
MRRLFVLVLLVAIAAGAVLFLGPKDEALSIANAATLSVLRGDVEAQKGSAAFAPAYDGDIFASGDVVRSKEQGRAVLTFFEGSTIAVEPGSEVKVQSLARVGDEGIQVLVEQTIGRTWTSVNKLRTPDARFEIKTPTMTAVVRGTTVETRVDIVNGQPTTTIVVGEGEVVITAAAGGTTTVTGGNQTTVPANAPPAAPAPTPPRPTLILQSSPGVGYVVLDPAGRGCGSHGGATVRQIPRCDVQGNTVTIGEIVAGPYTVMLTAAQQATATLSLQGRRGATVDGTVNLSQAMSLGDLWRTTSQVALAADGRIGVGQFAPAERLTSVCGAEARGRAFSSGTLSERIAALDAFAAQQRGQPVALVFLQQELTAEAKEGAGALGPNAPAQVSDVSVVIDNAGLHLSAKAAAGPLSVPIRGDVIAAATGGRLQLRIRRIDMGPLPGAIRDQVVAALERSLNEFSQQSAFNVERVVFRAGCMAVIGTTSR